MKLHMNSAVPQLHKAASKDGSRYAMTFIDVELVEPGKVRAVATDGRVLAVAELEADAADVTGLIPAEVWQAACKAKPEKKGTERDFHAIVANGSIKVTNKGAVTETNRTESGAQFPRWQSVLPDMNGRQSVRLNPRLLLAACEAMGMLDDAEGVTLSFEVNGGKLNWRAPVRLDTCEGRYGAIMPINL